MSHPYKSIDNSEMFVLIGQAIYLFQKIMIEIKTYRIDAEMFSLEKAYDPAQKILEQVYLSKISQKDRKSIMSACEILARDKLERFSTMKNSILFERESDNIEAFIKLLKHKNVLSDHENLHSCLTDINDIRNIIVHAEYVDTSDGLVLQKNQKGKRATSKPAPPAKDRLQKADLKSYILYCDSVMGFIAMNWYDLDKKDICPDLVDNFSNLRKKMTV